MTASEILKKYWGFDEFRYPQAQIIETATFLKDSLVLMPTGGGKSVCYQIPALMQPGICLVVSPLIALMTDQVKALENKNIKAISLAGNIPYDELVRLLDNTLFGTYKFVYLSPERLRNELVLAYIKQLKINLIAVDEAHCISEWGHDFRPAYREIYRIRELHPQVPVMALTASATAQVAKDIYQNLQLRNAEVFSISFRRKNIGYWTQQTDDKFEGLCRHLENLKDAAIVYVGSRKDTVHTAQFLKKKGFTADFFHGGMAFQEKNEKLDQWMKGKIQIIVATNAFGMGIDKANVRLVAHLNIPDSIENYYQEAGRAGRDGKESRAVILYNDADKDRLYQQFLSALPTVDAVKLVYRKLCNYLQIGYGDCPETIFYLNFNKFCQLFELPLSLTLNCLKILDNQAVINLNLQGEKKTTIRFLWNTELLLDHAESNPRSGEIIKLVLRNYAGVFDDDIPIKMDLLSKKSRIPVEAILIELTKLDKQGVVKFEAINADISVLFNEPREDDYTINRIAAYIRQQLDNKTIKAKKIWNYVVETDKCKSRLISAYFGEKTKENCGICSFCQATKDQAHYSKNRLLIHENIIELLSEKPLSSKKIAQHLEIHENIALRMLKNLLLENLVKVNDKNQFELIERH